ncbi:hypothetical protein WAI453_004974 [Rhynchosporium graminicola]
MVQILTIGVRTQNAPSRFLLLADGLDTAGSFIGIIPNTGNVPFWKLHILDTRRCTFYYHIYFRVLNVSTGLFGIAHRAVFSNPPWCKPSSTLQAIIGYAFLSCSAYAQLLV